MRCRGVCACMATCLTCMRCHLASDIASMHCNNAPLLLFYACRCRDLPLLHVNKRRFSVVLAIISGPAEPKTMNAVLDRIVTDFEQYGPGTDGLTVKYRQPPVPGHAAGADAMDTDEPALHASPHLRPVAGEPRGRLTTMQHRIFLTGLCADAPALSKCCLKVGHGAHKGCWWCSLLAEHDGAARFKGYNEPATVWGNDIYARDGRDEKPHEALLAQHTFPAAWQFTDANIRADCIADADDPTYCGLRFSHVDQVLRCMRSQRYHDKHINGDLPSRARADERQKNMGSWGLTPLARLPYIDFNSFFVVPVMHASLYGVVKDFVNGLFATGSDREWWSLPYASIRLIQQRGKHFKYPHDINRGYRDIATLKGYYTMEEYLHFVLFGSEYLFYSPPGREVIFPQPPPDFAWDDTKNPLRAMWDHLRGALVHYLNIPPHGGYSIDERIHARLQLVQYARLADRVSHSSLCTYNLHVLICRLFHQETARGAVSYDLELYVERMMQLVKSCVRGRSTHNPELVIVRYLVERTTMACLRLRMPDHCKTYYDLVKEHAQEAVAVATAARPSAHALPKDRGNSRYMLLGAGTRLSKMAPDDQAYVLASIMHFAFYAKERTDIPKALTRPSSCRAALDANECIMFTRALRAGYEIMHSTMYQATRTRSSVWAKHLGEEADLRAQAPGRGPTPAPARIQIMYACKIRCFALAWFDGKPMRFACADLYELTPLNKSLFDAGRLAKPAYACYALPLKDLGAKFIHCEDSMPIVHTHNFLSYFVRSTLATDDGIAEDA